MLAKLLSATLEPPSPDMAELVAELAAEGRPQRLDIDVVERVLMAKLTARQLLAERLRYLKDCMKACDEVRRDAKFPAPVLELLPKVAQMLGNYGALSLTCPELFGSASVAPDQAAAALVSMAEKKELPLNFIARVAEATEEESVDALFGPLLTAACARLQGRDLVDMKLEDHGWIQAACATKGPLAKILVKLPCFRPAPGTAPAPQIPGMMPGMMPGMGRGPAGEGFRLQSETLLGSLLSPTCLDTALFKERSARQIHFQNLTRKTRPAVSSAQSLLRHSLSEVMQQAVGVINPLLRTDEASREAVLAWFGTLITGTEPRTKSSNTLDEGGGPNHFVDSMENSPMPMHQNLDMRLGMQLVQARLQGFATPGMSVNVLWCLMELIKPIKLTQATSLDPFLIASDLPFQKQLIGGFSGESRFGDNDEVAKAKEFAAANNLLGAPKFTTQVFWLALRAVHVCLVPVLKEEICFAVAAGHFQNKDMAKMEAALGEHFLHETIFDSSAWLADLGHLLNLEMAFCLMAAFPDHATAIAEGKFRGSLTAEVSNQWTLLPDCILADLIEVMEYYINIRPPGQGMSEIFNQMNAELLLLLVTFMLGSGDHVKNPNLRGKATTILMSLAKNQQYTYLLETHPVLRSAIIPACICVFTAVEKTKQSYYDIRMQLKYQLRIPIMELFEKMLPLAGHKESLKNFAAERSDEFLKFLNQMMNDATMQLEEGTDTLIQIRKLVSEGGEAALSRPSGEQLDQDEQTAEGGDLYRRSRADPKEHCKTYMKMGNRTIRTLWNVCREAPTVVVSKLNVLQQLLHNCLNSCLDRLVGPRCLELKGASKDFEEFNFKPKELLQWIAEMYVFVSREGKDTVLKMITEDGRSYRPQTFQKAVSILRREQMISRDMLAEFEKFVQELNALAKQQADAMASVDIPDNYLDPIMSEIMEDPVLLPTSQTIMDRKVIERHIMSNDDDPFNRAHLSVDDLVPQAELKAEIQAFCAKHGIAVGGGEA